MTKNVNYLSQKKSKQVVNGMPKLPLATDLSDGELAINYAKGVETIAIKNDSGDVVTFSSDNYISTNYYNKSEVNDLISASSGGSGGTYITVNADWDEQDEDAPSFILNKPFGESDSTINIYNNPTKVLAQCGQHCFGDMNNGLYLSESIIDGNVYIVSVNGSEFVFTASTNDGLINLNWNGNPSTVETVAVWGNSTNVCISINDSLLNGNTSTASISITRKGNYIKKLDNKYLDLSDYYTKTDLDARDLWVSGTGLNSVVLKGSSGTASGDYSVAEGYNTTARGHYSHAEGLYTIASGSCSHAEGYNTTASGYSSHAEGDSTVAMGESSHAEGYGTKASFYYSHAEGSGTTASNNSSHAEGSNTKAMGESSHAEGHYTEAHNSSSHAEGDHTTANGPYSHAEGSYTKANGSYSHAEGGSTITNNQSEHASGRYNVSSKASNTFGNSGNTLFSVGNGTDNNARHNAFEIRQNGDIYISSGGTTTSQMIKLQDNLGGNIDLETYAKKDWVTSNYATKSEVPIIWTGTQAEYDAIETKDSSTIYLIK